jgi:hypothetical protein
VEVAVLDRLRHGAGKRGAARLERGCDPPQPVDLLGIERKVAREHGVVERGEEREPPVGHTGVEMLVDVARLVLLQLRITRERGDPRFVRVAVRADGRPRVREQGPRALDVVGDELDDAVRPPPVERGREGRLERLDGRARLEPRGAVRRQRHPPNARPRPVVDELDRPRRGHVRLHPPERVLLHSAPLPVSRKAG